MSMLDHALRYASIGWHVFPVHHVTGDMCSCGKAVCDCPGKCENPDHCRRPGKHPMTAKGFLNASTSTKKITYWWTLNPDANIGVACGPSGLFALDIDSQHLDAASGFLAALSQPTAHSVTGGGGRHLIYRAPAGISISSTQTLFAPVEFKGSNGTFTAPPSVHASGRSYEWVDSPFDMDPADFPQDLLDRLVEWEREKALVQSTAAANRAQYTSDRPELREVADALAAIPPRLHYEEWIKILMGVHSEFPGEDGVALCEAWSPGSRGEIAGEFARWNAKPTRTSIATVFWLAKQHGWTPPPKVRPERPQVERVDDMFADAETPDIASLDLEEEPEDYSTWPYATHDGRLCVCKKKEIDGEIVIEYTPLAEFDARIVKQIDLEDRRIYQIDGTAVRGGAFSVEVDAVEFGMASRLAATLDAAAGAQSPVHPNKASQLGPAIKMLSTAPRRVQRFNRVGWTAPDTSLYLLPGRPLPSTVEMDLPAQVAHYGIHPEADLSIGILMLEKLLRALPPENTTVVLAHLLGAPLGRMLKLRRYAMFVRGQSGSLKTSWCQAAMSMFGNFTDDAALIKFGSGSTYNALVALIAAASDMPVMVDNFKPNTKQAEDFASLIHMVLEGRDRNRLTQNMELRDAKEIHAWPLITGEDVPDSDAASLARMLVVPFVPRRDSGINDLLAEAQFNSHHLSAVGAAWLDWLEGAGRRVAMDMREEYMQNRLQWAMAVKNTGTTAMNPLRIADNLATNDLVYRIAMEHPAFGYVLRQLEVEHTDGLRKTASYMAETTAEASEVVRWLSMLHAMLVDGTAALLDTNGMDTSFDQERMIGWQDRDVVYIYMSNAMKQIRKQYGQNALNGISDRQIWQQLEGLGMFVAGKDPKPVQKRIGSAVHRVLWLDREAFDAFDESTAMAQTSVEELGIAL